MKLQTSTRPCALVVGVNGQDGAYLAQHLLNSGYRVVGTSRDAERCQFGNLMRLGIRAAVELDSIAPTDFRSVLRGVLRAKPDEIYNLSGQSSVGLSFLQPVETLDSNLTATINFLEAIRFTERPIRYYSAGSSECFGNVITGKATEESPFRPRSPYATSKASAFWMVANYRDAYGMFACSGILSNHESPLRSGRFVTQKIVQGAVAIARGAAETLTLGNLDVARDWGWAPEYVQAMHRMLCADVPEDYIIATGQTSTLAEFVDCAFATVGLRAENYLRTSGDLMRPSEIETVNLDPGKAQRQLGWSASTVMRDVVREMVAAELARCQEAAA